MNKKSEQRINELCDMVDKLHAKVEASKAIKSKAIAVLRRLLPDWHEDADNALRHDGHVIAEITFGDVRAIKALLREIEGE